MEFRESGLGDGSRAAVRVPVLLPARSLLIMTGAARYSYTHAIPARTFDPVPATNIPDFQQQPGGGVAMTTLPRGMRVSITFRTVRPPPCICRCGEQACHVCTCGYEYVSARGMVSMHVMCLHIQCGELLCHVSRHVMFLHMW